jgi:hypothetical protein
MLQALPAKAKMCSLYLEGMTSMRQLSKALRLAAGAAVCCTVLAAASPSRGDFLAVNPTDAAALAAFRSSTSLISLAGLPLGVPISSVTDGTLSVAFDHPRSPEQVGVTWATWSSPPFSETATPIVLPDFRSGGLPTATFTFSQALSAFGMELEPDPFGMHPITVSFFDGATLVGTISQMVEGSAGAREFAATTTTQQFTSVTISSDFDFAAAQLRYTTSVPEPGTLALSAVGFVGLLAYAWRRHRQAV